MTVVLVHGVPETDAIWNALVDALGRDDVVRLSPPGFGAPLPPDFGAGHRDYRGWLEAELERIGAPVDLVGHDWGGLHAVNVAMHRPDLLRSWVSDDIGIFDADYVWHDAAQVWHTPGAGEEFLDTMMAGSVDERAGQLTAIGIPGETARSLAAAQGADMRRAILALYRSAAQPVMAEAGADLEKAAARPGLCLDATEDPFVGTAENRRRAAQRAGAQTVVLDGLGHWWMLQDPARGADVLSRFWAELG
ncbi:Pimeloyl-ACP methyl ester carboxylesterase [Mycolicibacterium rutilum]|uniref:Pimeloyl-ACP methyl ester carboxylesterase n=1 Tax=Mycolicibacterium rutilum TaxID=370526 RepID=A0A1H6KVP8_MYCRU|nr:alpha/beta hydrolase [Mycolicibacterium rutilum]SEH75759.1 Pimeloyl-ACP methyl ester carboxylesterase [Mycolicibacterium rutilum]